MVFLDGALLAELPAGARDLDIRHPTAGNAPRDAGGFRTSAYQAPPVTTTIRQ